MNDWPELSYVFGSPPGVRGESSPAKAKRLSGDRVQTRDMGQKMVSNTGLATALRATLVIDNAAFTIPCAKMLNRRC